MDEPVFRIVGIQGVESNIQRVLREIHDKAVQGLYETGLKVKEASDENTPYKTGALRDTSECSEPIVDGKDTLVVISYGSDDVNYAIPVHERLDDIHPVGKAKFLESAVVEEESSFLRDIARFGNL